MNSIIYMHIFKYFADFIFLCFLLIGNLFSHYLPHAIEYFSLIKDDFLDTRKI